MGLTLDTRYRFVHKTQPVEGRTKILSFKKLCNERFGYEIELSLGHISDILQSYEGTSKTR